MGKNASKIAKKTSLEPPPAPVVLMDNASVAGAQSPVALFGKVRDCGRGWTFHRASATGQQGAW